MSTKKELQERNDELEGLFDLRWKADMKAIKIWQKETGRDLVWPDHTDMVVWLIKKLDTANNKIKKLQQYKDNIEDIEDIKSSYYMGYK